MSISQHALAPVFLGALLASCARHPVISSTADPFDSHADQAESAPVRTTPSFAFDAADLSEKVKPTVVNITTSRELKQPGGLDAFDFFFGPRDGREGRERNDGPRRRQQGAGSGFIIDEAGLVVTNAHVVQEADELRVRLSDGREFPAQVVGRDTKLDLALIKLRGARELPVAQLGSSEQLRVGEHVLAVGNPFGLGHTVTLGIVSGKARAIGAGPYDDFIQTDASINPGNSGGPLFNTRGEVVGINTAIIATGKGIGFAIPVDALKEVLPELRTKGHVERGKLGLSFQPLTPDLAQALGAQGSKGALVAEVEPGGAAQRAGIRSGDLIVAVDGKALSGAEELPRVVARHPPGSRLTLTVVQNKKQRDIAVTLDTLPREADGEKGAAPKGQDADDARSTRIPALNLRASDTQGEGARIDEVGANAGELEPGDVMLELEGKAVRGVADLRAIAARAKADSVVVAKVRRGTITRFVAVRVGRP